MKRIYYYILGIVALLAVVTGSTWIGAVNGEVRKRQNVIEATGNIYAKMGGRYEKVAGLIDAIEGANEAIVEFMTIIADARTAFANAIAANDLEAATGAAETIDATFIDLVSYMEDNPSEYSTVNLYSGYMAEFAASTNAVIVAVTTYNKEVNAYNTHIGTFPNLIFLQGKTPYETWVVPNYDTTLPTFH
jgi:LemA protein